MSFQQGLCRRLEHSQKDLEVTLRCKLLTVNLFKTVVWKLRNDIKIFAAYV